MVAIHLTKTDFDEKIKSGFVFVDFWAEWCGPCRMAAPVIDEIADSHAGKLVVAKLDVDAEPELSMRFNVMSIPTVILFKDGQEVGRHIGFSGKQGYLDLLTKAGL